MQRFIMVWSVCCVLALSAFADNANAQMHWKRAPGSKGLDTGELLDVWGSSANDVYAVGKKGTLLHFDGNSWSKVHHNFTDDFRAIWGSAANDVYIASNGGLLHFNGSKWRKIIKGYDLVDVYGTAKNHVLTITKDHLLYNKGKGWRKIKAPQPKSGYNDQKRIWSSGPNNTYISASKNMLHYDGKKLTRTPKYCENAIWGADADHVVCAKSPNSIKVLSKKKWALRNANAGNVISGLPTWLDINDVWGADPNNIFLSVGYDFQMLYFNGTKWTTVEYSGFVTNLNAIWGLSMDTAYAVGQDGIMKFYKN